MGGSSHLTLIALSAAIRTAFFKTLQCWFLGEAYYQVQDDRQYRLTRKESYQLTGVDGQSRVPTGAFGTNATFVLSLADLIAFSGSNLYFVIDCNRNTTHTIQYRRPSWLR